jgi:hypothetical protein
MYVSCKKEEGLSGQWLHFNLRLLRFSLFSLAKLHGFRLAVEVTNVFEQTQSSSEPSVTSTEARRYDERSGEVS